jgi:SAM-dependent methyltransferase
MSSTDVAAYYTRPGLEAAILQALVATGKDPEHIGPDDLATIEEFHTLGRPATLALAGAAEVRAGELLLDVGSGIGGPARTLARSHGCRVIGIDLTAEMCAVAQDLNRRTGYADRIHIVEGDALALPFRDGSFDVVWTQHVTMNIAAKGDLYPELRRAVRPGGRLAFFDVIAGPNQPIHLPVMWASDASANFLSPAEELRDLVNGAGFRIRLWEDTTDESMAFFQMAMAMAGSMGPLGLQLLIPDLPTKIANMIRNLQEDRVRLLRCVAEAVED